MRAVGGAELKAGLRAKEDGIPFSCDNADRNFNPTQADIDADGIGDITDLCPVAGGDPNNTADSDNDGVGNVCDTCRQTLSGYNDGADLAGIPAYMQVRNIPYQDDADEDGIGDVCDNCVWVPNCESYGNTGTLTEYEVGDPIAFTDDKTLVSVSMDRTIRLWTTAGLTEAKKEPEKKEMKKDAKKEPEKKDGKDKKDAKEPEKKAEKDPNELKKFGPTPDDPFAVAWHAKTKSIGVCGYSGLVSVWKADGEKPTFSKGIKSPGYCVAFTADGKALVSGHDNGTVVVTPVTGK